MTSLGLKLFSSVKKLLENPEFTILTFVILNFSLKIHLMQPAATNSLFLPTFQHDAPIFAAMILICVGGLTASRSTLAIAVWLRRFAFSFCLLLIFFYSIDVFIYYCFVTRLYISDLVTFISEVDSIKSLLWPSFYVVIRSPKWQLVLMLVIGFLLLHACRSLFYLRFTPRVRLMSLFAVALIFFYAIPLPQYIYGYMDKPYYENFFERNSDYFNNTNFSDTFRAELRARSWDLPTIHHDGLSQRLNVIIVIVESLSVYHSKLFSGVKNWTPNLDRIAEHETALINFFANGWTTIGGLVSILGRTFPVVPEKTAFNTWGSPRLTDFMAVQRPLPRVMAERGYATVFVAAGDLSFLGQEQWLRAIGFDRQVGHDDLRYANQKIRGPFKSVPDSLLFEVAAQEIESLSNRQPFFMTIQTYWSHRPFISSSGNHVNDEEIVIRETDHQIGRFYDQLDRMGFFDHGILILTGDHRAMEPFHKQEFERFGESAIARIPGLVVTHAIKLPHVIDQDFQQRDIGASIESLVDSVYALRPQEGTFLTPRPIPSHCIIHARGNSRDLVYIKCGSSEGTIKIDGDDTRFENGVIADTSAVIRTINLTRARPPIPEPDSLITSLKHEVLRADISP